MGCKNADRLGVGHNETSEKAYGRQRRQGKNGRMRAVVKDRTPDQRTARMTQTPADLSRVQSSRSRRWCPELDRAEPRGDESTNLVDSRRQNPLICILSKSQEDTALWKAGRPEIRMDYFLMKNMSFLTQKAILDSMNSTVDKAEKRLTDSEGWFDKLSDYSER